MLTENIMLGAPPNNKERYFLLTEKYARDVGRLTESLKDLYNSNCGLPKSCGHEFTCTCPGERAKELIELFRD